LHCASSPLLRCALAWATSFFAELLSSPGGIVTRSAFALSINCRQLSAMWSGDELGWAATGNEQITHSANTPAQTFPAKDVFTVPDAAQTCC
jgi:hypothetical protein